MELFSRTGFERFVLELPGVTVAQQWESRVAKVCGKVFALIGETHEHVTFKVTEIAFAGLSTLPEAGQAPYFAKGQWVSLGPGCGLSDAELAQYLRQAHALIAAKLTRKARLEIGLDA